MILFHGAECDAATVSNQGTGIRHRRHCITALCAAVMLAASAVCAAVDATLQWEAPTNNVDGSRLTDLGGFIVYHGLSSKTYGTTQDVGNVIITTVTNLQEGVTHYFTAIAYDSGMNTSDPAVELSWPAPDLTAPAIEGPSTVSLVADAFGQAILGNIIALMTITDNVSPANQIAKSQSPAAGVVLQIGTTVVTVTAIDGAGNTAQVAVAVEVGPKPRPRPPRNLRVIP